MRQIKISKQITNRENISLDKYLHEISKIELLSVEEEVILARRIKEGDNKALEKLTNANLRFVVSVAKQYQNRGLTLGDLINDGNLGLIKAAKRFDETRGFKFISYAVWWIRQAILQAIAEYARIVRLPLNQVGSMNKIARTFSDLEQQFEREPSTEEVAAILDLAPFDITNTLNFSGKHLSIDAPIKGEELNLLDIIENNDHIPDAYLMNDSLQTQVKIAISILTQREAEVICYYFGLDNSQSKTLEEIGRKLNLTRERVRQIKDSAIRRLRQSNSSNKLKPYLG